MPINNNLKNPRVTLFIPAYNEEKLLPHTLDHISHQDFEEEYELIVIDNASTDKTAQIAKEFGARVILEETKGNRFAVERGFKEAKGEIVIQIDADTNPPTDFIRRVVKEYDNPKVVGVGTRIKFYDAPKWITWLNTFIAIINPREAMWGASLSSTKQAWKELGGFNKGFDLNSDAYYTLQLRKIGKVVIIKDLYMPMSGRRYNGSLWEIMKNSKDLLVSAIWMIFTGKPLSSKPFKDIR